VVKETLKHYYDDRRQGVYLQRTGEIIRQEDKIITRIF
jgi:hypothetical protein